MKAVERFGEQVALVTGGSAGIGRAIAMAFAEQGMNVILADIRVEEGQARVVTATQGSFAGKCVVRGREKESG